MGFLLSWRVILTLIGAAGQELRPRYSEFLRIRGHLDHSAFGIVEEWDSSMLLILHQLNMNLRARQYCTQHPRHSTVTNRADSYNVSIIRYGTAQRIAERLGQYERIYSYAQTVFFDRLAAARRHKPFHYVSTISTTEHAEDSFYSLEPYPYPYRRYRYR